MSYAAPEYAVDPYGSGGHFQGGRLPRVGCYISFTTDPGDEPVWEDVSLYLRRFSTRRGRQYELDQFAAGTATITLDNRDRRFDPDYASSPYYPNVVPMRRVKIVPLWGFEYTIFDGYIDGWPQSYNQPHEARVDVPATDAFKVLSLSGFPESVYAYEVRQDEPVHWWRMGEKQGGVMLDSGSDPVSGTYNGAVTYGVSPTISPYDSDTAMEFIDPDADDGGYFQVPTGVGSGDWTLEFWNRDCENSVILAQADRGRTEFYWTLQTAMSTLVDGNGNFLSRFGRIIFNILDPSGAGGTAPDPGWDGYVPPAGSNQVTPTINAGPSPLVLGMYTDVAFPAGTYFNQDWHVTPEYEARDGLYWAQQFWFDGGDGGYAGLQANGFLPDGRRGKVALFAIWQALNSQGGNPDAIAGTFAGEGEGYRVIMPFEWEAGRKYRFRVWKLADDGSGNTWWGCWIKDTVTLTETFMGQILVPAAWGDLQGAALDFSEIFWPTKTTCSSINYGSVLFGQWSANNGTVSPSSYSSRFTDSVSCDNARLSDVASISSTVRHEFGTPAPDALGTPGQALWVSLTKSNVTEIGQAGWHHIVITKSGSTLSLYVDGEFKNSTTYSGTPPPGDIYGPTSQAPPGAVVAFDELALYDHALSAARIQAHYDAAVSAWAGETSDARIDRALDQAGFSSSARSLQVGKSNMGAAVLNSQSVMAHIQDAALAEGGDFYIAADGTATSVNRHHLITSPGNVSQAVFGDDPTPVP